MGDLFTGALLPGLLLVALYLAWLGLVAWKRPAAMPAPIDNTETVNDGALLPRVLKGLLPPLLLIVAVLVLAAIALVKYIRSDDSK